MSALDIGLLALVGLSAAGACLSLFLRGKRGGNVCGPAGCANCRFNCRNAPGKNKAD